VEDIQDNNQTQIVKWIKRSNNTEVNFSYCRDALCMRGEHAAKSQNVSLHK